MFIERSAARIRLARTLFVLLGVLPCAGLCGWAAVRHSSGHRESIERRCEQAIGLPLAIGSVEHVRPHVMRLRDCRLSAASGAVVLAVPAIEVEALAHELRVTLDRLDCTPELARVLAALARDWLRQPARFPVDCVVDVGDFSWRPRQPVAAGGMQSAGPETARAPARPLHVECVAANGSRAVRVRRTAEGGQAPDEVRVVAGGLMGAVGEGANALSEGVAPIDQGGAGVLDEGVLEVTGTVMEPLPIAVFEALVGLEPVALPLGDEATVSGTFAAVLDGGLGSGSARGRVDRIDLASASLYLPHRVSGEALLAVDRLAWSHGRITACDCQCSVSRGRLGQRLLDACVSALGCRPGPAYRSLAREEIRGFDDVSAFLRIDSAGLELRASPGRGGCLARTQGLSILDEPQGAVPLERMAWLLAQPGAVAVPASKATAWLLGFFSLDPPMGAQGGGATPVAAPGPGNSPGIAPGNSPGNSFGNQRDQAGRPLGRSEF
jgi:hypothetical protein